MMRRATVVLCTLSRTFNWLQMTEEIGGMHTSRHSNGLGKSRLRPTIAQRGLNPYNNAREATAAITYR